MANIMKVPIRTYAGSTGTGTPATAFRYVRCDSAFQVASNSYPGTSLKILFLDGSNSNGNCLEWNIDGAKNVLTEAGINRVNDALLANANKPGSIFDIEELLNKEGIVFEIQANKATDPFPTTTSQP